MGNWTAVTQVADSMGLSHSSVGTIVAISTVQVFMLGAWRATGSLRIAWVASMAAVIFLVFLGFMPVWLAVAYGVMGGAFVMLPVFMGLFRDGEFMPDSKTNAEQNLCNANWEGLNRMRYGEPAENPEELILRIEKSSQKWAEYINNLDALLGVKTVDYTGDGVFGLDLDADKFLYISRHYHWYIVDKLPDQDIFKIVGLHKKDASKNLVYLLGKNSQAGEPFLIKLPERYIEVTDFQQYLSWISNNDKKRINSGQAETELVKLPASQFLKSIGYHDAEDELRESRYVAERTYWGMRD